MKSAILSPGFRPMNATSSAGLRRVSAAASSGGRRGSAMRSVEVTRAGNRSIADQLAEMREWLAREGIAALELEPGQIRLARASFRAVFASEAEAERFACRFDEPRDVQA